MSEANEVKGMSEEKKMDAILGAIPWRCFHCDFITSDPVEAEAHFGDRDDASEFKPICKWWTWMSESERIAALQGTIRDLNAEQRENMSLRTAIEGLEYQVGLLYNKEFNGYKPFREAKVTSVYEAFCLYDSMEGRALAAEEKLAAIESREAAL